jgi:hypothetical protein
VSLETIVVAGALAAKPGNGGEAWVRLSWVLGLRRLGFDAWLVEEADAGTAKAGRSFFEETVERHGLGSRAVLLEPGEAVGPLERDELEDLAADAAALVNISGNLREEDLLSRFRRRAYVDLDPGFTQIWHAEGHLGNQLAVHDTHFTVGLNLGDPGCPLPVDGIGWVPLPPPVLLEEWSPLPDPRLDRFTTVATWRNALGGLEADGIVYTLKHHQLRRFATLPERVQLPFEIALEIHPEEADEVARLRENGWTVIEPGSVTADPLAFRDYVRGSGAEFSVTQGVYAEARTGWVSDRTAHYLASGRPAVVQETGVPDRFRAEAGMLTFADLDEAASATTAIAAEYERHSAAARAYAERTFDSDVVLTRMLEAVL